MKSLQKQKNLCIFVYYVATSGLSLFLEHLSKYLVRKYIISTTDFQKEQNCGYKT